MATIKKKFSWNTKFFAQKDLEKGLHRFGAFLAVRQFGERVFR